MVPPPKEVQPEADGDNQRKVQPEVDRVEELDQRVVRWIPYGTLLLPTLLTLIDGSIPWPSRVATLGLE